MAKYNRKKTLLQSRLIFLIVSQCLRPFGLILWVCSMDFTYRVTKSTFTRIAFPWDTSTNPDGRQEEDWRKGEYPVQSNETAVAPQSACSAFSFAVFGLMMDTSCASLEIGQHMSVQMPTVSSEHQSWLHVMLSYQQKALNLWCSPFVVPYLVVCWVLQKHPSHHMSESGK